jgi:hypothetical protein
MTIISKEILTKHGPYIKFADCPIKASKNRLIYQRNSDFDGNIFYEMPIDLLETWYSVATRIGLDIDPYEFVELDNSYEIRKLASELLVSTFVLTRTHPQVFKRIVLDDGFYEGSLRPHDGGNLTGEHLRLDMIETLLFLIGRFSKIAQAKRCLVIAGV